MLLTASVGIFIIVKAKGLLTMYFLRVDYVPSSGCGVMRIRSLHDSLKSALSALRHVEFEDDKILLVRIELCG